MKTYRVAILGCRGRGTAAARSYHAHPRTEIVGLCDLVPELLETLGDELSVEARYDDFDRMIREEAPDIVAIPVATQLHYELGMAVLEHGVHIDVEKPICTTLEQADKLVAKAAEKDVRIAVHHQGRTGVPMRAVAEAYRSGAIGELRYVHASGKGYYGGYGLLNIGTHSLNAMMELTGSCHSVTALGRTGGHTTGPADVVPSPNGMGTMAGEYLTATLAFDGNHTGTLLQHRFSKVDISAYSCEFYGTEGRLFWGSRSAGILRVPSDVPGGKAWEPLPLVNPDGYDPESSAAADDYGYVDEYVNALDEDRPHRCSGEVGRHVLEIIMGIFESVATGKRVDLPQLLRSHPLPPWREAAGHGPTPDMPTPYWDWLAAEDERQGQ
ncbi:MAG: hypothetical protein CME26_14750 [Gemmatimonadetes bacterium]|nr:hypothetical protein [Gemmatimonadota bacterium]|tara:strand:+ start:3316 stop:4464 length:1149 start_codon:yes stop_codon:yes gene_type:complete